MLKLTTLTIIALGTLFAQPKLDNVQPSAAIAATSINDLLLASADTKYAGTYNGMSPAEASLALGYAKIAVEQAELEFYRANNQFTQGFDFLRSQVIKARKAKSAPWDKMIVEEYYKVLGLQIQRSETAMMIFKKVLEISDEFDYLAKNIKKDETQNWDKANRASFDLWLKKFDGINTLYLSQDHDPILREAASHMPEGRARKFHMSSYEIAPGTRVITCYPIKGCSEPMPVR